MERFFFLGVVLPLFLQGAFAAPDVVRPWSTFQEYNERLDKSEDIDEVNASKLTQILTDAGIPCTPSSDHPLVGKTIIIVGTHNGQLATKSLLENNIAANNSIEEYNPSVDEAG